MPQPSVTDPLVQQLIARAEANSPSRNINLPAPPLQLGRYERDEDQDIARHAPPGAAIRPVRPRDVGGIEALDHILASIELAKAGAYPHGMYDRNALTPQKENEAWSRGLRRSGDLMHEDLERMKQEEAQGFDPNSIYQILRK